MGTTLSAGSSFKWLRDTFYSNEHYDSLVNAADSVSVGSEGLIFLPYLTGERTPHNNPNARGVFFGLHLGHEKGHLARAVMEGVCFALRDSLELMLDLNTPVKYVRTIGGGTRTPIWRQIQADVFNLPVVINHLTMVSFENSSSPKCQNCFSGLCSRPIDSALFLNPEL